MPRQLKKAAKSELTRKSNEFEMQLHGVVTHADGSPAVAIDVIAYDKDVSGADELGRSATDQDGRYCIVYRDTQFRRSKNERRGPDVFVRVFDEKGQLLVQSKTHQNAPPVLELNVQLPKQQFVVQGTIRDTAGLPAADVTVVAFDRDLRKEEPLGQATTDKGGRYIIRYAREDFCRAEKETADLRVAVLDRNQREIASSAITFNAAAEETIDLLIDANQAAASEYERLRAVLAPLLQDVSLADLTDDDVEFLVGDTGEDRQRIRWLSLAAQRSQQTTGDTGLPIEAFYAWFREHLPTELALLLAIQSDQLIAVLKLAIERNIVPAQSEKALERLRAAIDALRVERALQPAAPDQPASVGDLLSTMPVELSPTKLRIAADALFDTAASDEQLAKRLEDADFNREEIASVKVTRALGDLSFGNAGLVQELQQLRDNRSDDSLRFLAPITPTQWLELADKHQAEGQSANLSFETYAEQLERAVEQKHPTAVFTARIASGHVHLQDAALKQATSVLAANPEFELKSANVRDFVDGLEGIEAKESLVYNLQHVQRAQKMAADWRETGVLLNRGLNSAHHIVQLGPTAFQAAVEPNISAERAKAIYGEAQHIHNITAALIANIQVGARTWAYGGGWGGATKEDPLPDQFNYPNLRRLFGNLTTCECSQCQSVLSPAAYLVDLLRFLDPKFDPSSGAAGLPAIATLLGRRPDIADLELTCDNAHTEIPYIDLVLEVLENAIGLPIAIPAPYGFDPQTDLTRNPMSSNTTSALRRVLERSAITVGEQLTAQKSAKQLLIGTFVDWTVSDGARHWNLRHYPQSLVGLVAGIVPKQFNVTDYTAARNRLDQGQLPDITWIIPVSDMPRGENLPLKGSPQIAQVRTGLEWKVSYTRAARIAFVMANPMSAILIKTADGQTQLSAQQYPVAMVQRVFFGLRNGQILEPLLSLLPEGLQYTITSVAAAEWEVAISYDMPINYFAERLQLTALTYQSSSRRDDLRASPENRNPEAYNRVNAAVYPWTLPFNLWLEEVRAFLARRGVARRTLIEHCKPAVRLTDEAIAREVLSLSLAEWNIVAAVSPRDPWVYWGLQQTGNTVVDRNDEKRTATGSWMDVLGFNVSILMQQAGLSYRELLNVLQTRFVQAATPVLTPSGHDCDPSRMTLQGLTQDHLDRIHRLVRLWRKVGGSIFDLDLAVTAATTNPTTLNEAKLLRVANLHRLGELLRLPIAHVAAWWGSLTIGYHDYVASTRSAVKSIYEQLFLNPTLLNPPDADFKLNSQQTELANTNPANPPSLSSKSNVIATVLSMTQSEFDTLVNDLVARQELDNPPTLKLANLQSLLRNVSMAKALCVSITDYVRLRSLIAAPVFASPASAIEFAEQARSVLSSGFSVDELEYLLQDKPDGVTTTQFSAQWASAALTELRASLQSVRDEVFGLDSDAAATLRKVLVGIGWYQELAEEAAILFASAGQLETQIAGSPTVVVPTAIANLVAYRQEEGRLIASAMLTANQWSTLESANTGAVVAAITALRNKVTAFSASLTAVAHRMQSFELPLFDIPYAPTSAPVFPPELAERCYFNAATKRVVFVGWMSAAQEDQVEAATAATVASALKTKSDQYTEAVAINRFFTNADDVRALFAATETPQTRLRKVLQKLLPHLYRTTANERLAQVLELDPRVVAELFAGKLNRATTLDALIATEFADSDARVIPSQNAFPNQFRALCKLHKAALVCRTLNVQRGELRWLPPAAAPQSAFDVLALDALPSAASDAVVAYAPWQKLVRLFQLRAQATQALQAPIDAALFDQLQRLAGADPATLTAQQADLASQLKFLALSLNSTLDDVSWAAQSQLNLQWPADYQATARVAALVPLLVRRLLARAYDIAAQDVAAAVTRLALAWPADFLNPNKLGDLLQLLATVQRLGASANECFSLAEDAAATTNTPAKPGKIEAALARRLLRARYDDHAWPQQLKLIVDPLRHRQRNALVAYLIANPPRNALSNGVWRDANDLYEHYLIDPQMSACRGSSRILHAISAVQLFVQRCLMNLEQYVAPAQIDAERWTWMKNYRVWEANRKVFLYPENWIEPELRDDKSELFKELEGQLQQSEFDHERAQDILKAYLKQLEDVSNLAVVGMFVERVGTQGEAEMRVHVVGRTRNRPARFFYRRWLLSKRVNRWEPWEQVALEGVKSDHVLPFVMRGDVYIAWPEMTQLAAEPGLGDTAAPGAKWRVQMAWIRRTSRGWTDRLLSSEIIEHPWVYGKDENQTFTFRVRTESNRWIDIDCYGAKREGVILYQAPSTADVTPSRLYFPLTSGAPFIKVQISGSVFASYANGTVFRPLAGASVRAVLKFNGTAAENETASRDVKWDEDHGLRIAGAPPYLSTTDSSVATDANGNFSLTLWLAAWQHGNDIFGGNRDAGYFHPRVLITNPSIELLVTFENKPQQSKSFSYKDTNLNATYQHYTDLRFEHNFVFAIGGTAPGGEADRPVTIAPVKTCRIYTADDAELLPLTAALQPPLPSGVLTYGSGFKAIQANQSGALTMPNSAGNAVTVWTGVSPTHSLLPAAPFGWPPSEVAVYRDANNSYFIRKQSAGIDPQGAQDRFQIIVNGHPRASDLRFAVSRDGIPALFDLAQQSWQATVAFDSHTPGTSVDTARSLTQPAIRFEPDEAHSPYASYNAELFFHVPLLIATQLSSNQRFADAQQWFHLIFDPTSGDTATGGQRYWRYLPFRKHSQTKPIDELLTLLGNPSVLASDTEKQQITTQIDVWSKNPFRPHAVARLRPRAYQFAVVFKYLDNLIAWGDSLFRQYTTESINEATQLYIVAAKLLGPRPQSIPRSSKRQALTYRRVNDQWDDFSNAWLELEANLQVGTGIGFLPGGTLHVDPLGKDGGISAVSSVGMLYFCVPHNEKLIAYWDKVEERLFNIRHCRNIDGIEQSVPLFQPPIDPALLVRATAAGLDIGAVLADASAPLPLYRFNVLLQKAGDLCSEVTQLGGALLSALEKKDAEQMSQLRARQEVDILTAVSEVKQAQIDEANANVDALRQSEKTAIARFLQYQRLLGNAGAQVPNDFDGDIEQTSAVALAKADSSSELTNLGLTQAEIDQINWSEVAMRYGVVAGSFNVASGILHAFPDITAGTPFLNQKFGGSNLGSIASASAALFSVLERNATHQSSRSATIASYQRRQDDWVFQSRMALKEVQQIRRQIIAAQIRADIATKDLANHKKQIKNAEEADRFLREKYTNRELYQWMTQQISSVYFRAYQMAYDVAKRAEQAFRFELGLNDSNYIQFSYWDSLKKGLLAGEKLGHDLKRLDVAYLDQNRREYEITKHVSLLSLDPLALIALRETGRCEISLPEVLFDLEYPGHYLRRIKSIGLTIPCVTGPYASVSCTLTLLKSSVRRSSAVGSQYQLDSTGDPDPRFRERFGPIQSIVTSNAQQDSGLFETNLRDERYLPFEGAGAISTWRLEMPTQFRQFDYDTIADAILHVRYTARDGGTALKQACISELSVSMNAVMRSSADIGLMRMFSLRHEFPEQWHRLTSSAASTVARSEEFALSKSRFPMMFAGRAVTLTVSDVAVCVVPTQGATNAPTFPKVFLPKQTATSNAVEAQLQDAAPIGDISVKRLAANYGGSTNVVVAETESGAAWQLRVEASDLAAFRSTARDVFLVCRYSVS